MNTAYWRYATVAWMAGVLAVSLLPSAPGNGGPGWHILGYGGLAFLLRAWQGAVPAALTAWGYGAVVELLQWLVPSRSAEVVDLLANAAGAAVGLAVWELVRRRRP